MTGRPVRACVVLDFAPIRVGADRRTEFGLEVATAGGPTFRERAGFRAALRPAEVAAAVAAHLVKDGFQAERGGDRVRVYGWADATLRVRPATRGAVDAPDVPAGERPTVRNPADPD